jgi:hypothetical protein
MRSILLSSLLCVGAWAAEQTGFELVPQADQTEIKYQGKVVASYLTANDLSNGARANETYKPYLRIVDPATGLAITKGPGGTYTHHRGIFIGWMRIALDNQRLDLWSMGSGRQIHTAFKEKTAGANDAKLVSLVDWKDKSGRLIISEERTMVLSALGAPGFLQVDFTSTVTAEAGDLNLEADPEHGGVHYRAPEEVDGTKTQYFFPVAKPQPHKDLDYRWVGMTYVLGEKTYGVVEINHPGNPTGTKWSAYRDYARFGAYPHATLKKGEKLTLRYRFLISSGQLVPVETILKSEADFVGKAVEPVALTPMAAEPKVVPKPKAK